MLLNLKRRQSSKIFAILPHPLEFIASGIQRGLAYLHFLSADKNSSAPADQGAGGDDTCSEHLKHHGGYCDHSPTQNTLKPQVEHPKSVSSSREKLRVLVQKPNLGHCGQGSRH